LVPGGFALLGYAGFIRSGVAAAAIWDAALSGACSRSSDILRDVKRQYLTKRVRPTYAVQCDMQ